MASELGGAAAERLVVIGGSAGALPGLLEIVRQLPADFPAAVLVVIHLSPDYPSRLPDLLNGASALDVRPVQSGEVARPGRLYAAPPDQHLLLQAERVMLSHGPRENRSRPSIDVLFRSAAYAYGQNVLGVLLSGMLDDGVSGLWTIGQFGGHTVVQHPEEAPFPSMPLNAVQRVEVDHVLRVAEIGPRLLEWVQGGPEQRPRKEGTMDKRGSDERERQRVEVEVRVASEDNAFEAGVLNLGTLSPFTCTCPECHGVMVRIKEGGGLRFRCHTGHAFTAAALLSELRVSVEATMWSAVRALDENVMLLEHLQHHLADAGDRAQSEVFGQETGHVREQGRLLRELAMQSRQRRQNGLVQSVREDGEGEEERG